MKKKEFNISIEGQIASISSAAELMAILDLLNSVDDETVLLQMGENISEIVVSGRELNELVLMLSEENRNLLIRLMAGNLPIVIGNATSLAHLLALLADEKSESVLIQALGRTGLHSLIISCEEFALVLEWVYDSSDELILEIVGLDFLLEKCRTGYELSLILQSLNSQSQKNILEKIGGKVLESLIHNARDLVYLLRAMPLEVSIGFIEKISSVQLKKAVRNISELNQYRTLLEKEEYILLTKKI